MKKTITILAIETSCDETALALLNAKKNGNFKILSNIISSQIKIHKKYGGIYPTLAKREHQRNLVLVLKKSLSKAGLLKLKTKKRFPTSGQKKSEIKVKEQKLEKILKREKTLYEKLKAFLKKYQKPKVNLIAVTTGPGLEPCLWVGVNFAKALSYFWNIPVLPVNHIESHILVNFLDINPSKRKNAIFPAVVLVVSGGHTQLILMKDIGKYKILGETRDDAAGECFDKTARILGLDYPGGPAIEKEAKKDFSKLSKKYKINLPRPMLYSKDYDFSFSGLKTAVFYKIKKDKKKIKNKNYLVQIAKEIQQAIIDVLIKKTIKAIKEYKAKTIILGGGVAVNEQLRKQLKIKANQLKVNFLFPPKKFCTDNAVMVGTAGYFLRLKEKKNWQNLKANANLRIGD